MAAVAFVSYLGLAFVWPTVTIYIHTVLGRPVAVAGVVLMFYCGASFFGQLLGGFLYDRVGGRPVIVLGLLLSATIIAIPGLTQSWPLYVGALVLFGLVGLMLFPALSAMAAATWPEGGRGPFNLLYVAGNAGVAVGTALGGLLAAYSFQSVYLAAALLFLATLVLALRLPRSGEPGPGSATSETSAAPGPEVPGAPAAIPWLSIGPLLGALLAVWLVYMQWSTTLSVYMQGLGITLPAYSLLWTLNGLIVVFGQPVLNLFVTRRRSLYAQLHFGIWLYVLSFGLLLTTSRYAIFVAAIAIVTFGEMLLWPGIPAAIDRLAPKNRRGFLLGAAGGAAAAGRTFGPLIGGSVYDNFGPGILLWSLPIALVAPLSLLALAGRAVRTACGEPPAKRASGVPQATRADQPGYDA